LSPDRTSVITKWQHEEYTDYAKQFVNEVVGSVVEKVSPQQEVLAATPEVGPGHVLEGAEPEIAASQPHETEALQPVDFRLVPIQWNRVKMLGLLFIHVELNRLIMFYFDGI
jgi:hypothetical protein